MLDHAAPTDHSLLQDPAFAGALRSLGQTPLTLPNGQLLLRRVLMGLPVLMLPRATPPPDLRAQLSALGLHRLPLILSPDGPCARPAAIRLRAPQIRVILDLSPDIDTRRAALHGKWRNALRRAEKSNLTVRRTHLPPDPNHPLLQAETEQARIRGYGNWPAALTAAFAGAAQKQAQLFTAKQGKSEVAQVLFLRHGAQASYHIGMISDAGKACAAHNLLIWNAMNWLAKTGCHSIDLGLVHPKEPGLTRFKTRTGAQLRPTGGTWLQWNPLARKEDT
jgi:hypothetical protein